MALQIGDKKATYGMSKSIYDELDLQLSSGMTSEALGNVRPSWQKLAFAIAKGVVKHIKSNMEIHDVKTKGKVNTEVKGKTARSDPGNHQHSVALSGKQTEVVFTQSNDGTGHVK
jgi:hypothetical protein